MNERLKEFAEQAGLDAKEIREDESLTLYAFEDFDLERFAELVRADEREANAKLCESEGHRIDASWESCATAIRARGDK